MNFYLYNGSFQLWQGFNGSYVLTLPADAPYASMRRADGMYLVTKAGQADICSLEQVGHVFFPRVDFGMVAHVAFFRGFHEKVAWALHYLDQGVSEASKGLVISFPVLQNVETALSQWQGRNHQPVFPSPGTYIQYTSWAMGLVKAAERSLLEQHVLAPSEVRTPRVPWFRGPKKNAAYHQPVIKAW